MSDIAGTVQSFLSLATTWYQNAAARTTAQATLKNHLTNWGLFHDHIRGVTGKVFDTDRTVAQQQIEVTYQAAWVLHLDESLRQWLSDAGFGLQRKPEIYYIRKRAHASASYEYLIVRRLGHTRQRKLPWFAVTEKETAFSTLFQDLQDAYQRLEEMMCSDDYLNTERLKTIPAPPTGAHRGFGLPPNLPQGRRPRGSGPRGSGSLGNGLRGGAASAYDYNGGGIEDLVYTLPMMDSNELERRQRLRQDQSLSILSDRLELGISDMLRSMGDTEGLHRRRHQRAPAENLRRNLIHEKLIKEKHHDDLKLHEQVRRDAAELEDLRQERHTRESHRTEDAFPYDFSYYPRGNSPLRTTHDLPYDMQTPFGRYETPLTKQRHFLFGKNLGRPSPSRSTGHASRGAPAVRDSLPTKSRHHALSEHSVPLESLANIIDVGMLPRPPKRSKQPVTARAPGLMAEGQLHAKTALRQPERLVTEAEAIGTRRTGSSRYKAVERNERDRKDIAEQFKDLELERRRIAREKEGLHKERRKSARERERLEEWTVRAAEERQRLEQESRLRNPRRWPLAETIIYNDRFGQTLHGHRSDRRAAEVEAMPGIRIEGRMSDRPIAARRRPRHRTRGAESSRRHLEARVRSPSPTPRNPASTRLQHGQAPSNPPPTRPRMRPQPIQVETESESDTPRRQPSKYDDVDATLHSSDATSSTRSRRSSLGPPQPPTTSRAPPHPETQRDRGKEVSPPSSGTRRQNQGARRLRRRTSSEAREKRLE